jgi:hypothetical protein
MRQGGAENLKIDDHQGVESLAGLVIGGAELDSSRPGDITEARSTKTINSFRETLL